MLRFKVGLSAHPIQQWKCAKQEVQLLSLFFRTEKCMQLFAWKVEWAALIFSWIVNSFWMFHVGAELSAATSWVCLSLRRDFTKQICNTSVCSVKLFGAIFFPLQSTQYETFKNTTAPLFELKNNCLKKHKNSNSFYCCLNNVYVNDNITKT